MQPPASTQPMTQVPQPVVRPAEYIPQPSPQPFSSEDSTDAIALRAAISALQFQKKKAQDDLRTLQATKQHALDNPQQFRDALAAGRLKEHRPQFGGVQAIFDQAESDDDEERAALGADAEDEVMQDGDDEASARPLEVPDSQPSRPSTSSGKQPEAPPQAKPADFSQIPGPQNVVRMPHINWEKYHIVGEPLDRMHEQQRRWPGSSFAYGQDKGREYAVAAPYSPFYDQLEGRDANGSRKDSVAPSHALATPTGTVSEHPMETRRSSKNQERH